MSETRYYGATPEERRIVTEWRDAAIADGWSHAPTYPRHEDEGRACTLNRDGYTAMILTRDDTDRFKGVYGISLWCPRGMALAVPKQYSFETLERNRRLCSECKQLSDDIRHVAFANRVCAACEPAARKKYEYPGWNN